MEAVLKYMYTDCIELPTPSGFSSEETYYARLYTIAVDYQIPTLELEALDMFKTLTWPLAQAKCHDRAALSTWFSELVAYVYDDNQCPEIENLLTMEVLELAIHLKSLSIAADEEIGENILMKAPLESPAFGRDLCVWEILRY